MLTQASPLLVEMNEQLGDAKRCKVDLEASNEKLMELVDRL